jgi:hypothetical protein
MNITDAQTRGYPAIADILDQAEDLGLEGIALGNSSYIEDYWKSFWGMINALRWAMTLGVYPASATTFNVRGGDYLWRDTVKTYTPGAAVDPTNNDTTYVWMADDNTIGSAVDGTGWPTDEHIPLAEIDVDSDGVITAVRDVRGKTMMRAVGNIAPADLKVITSSIGVPFVISATLTAGNTAAIYSSNAPFKLRVLDAWSVAKSADGGTWKLTDGTNDITNAVAVTATDKTVNRVGTIDDAYHEIAAGGSLSVVGDGSLADAAVYVLCARVS